MEVKILTSFWRFSAFNFLFCSSIFKELEKEEVHLAQIELICTDRFVTSSCFLIIVHISFLLEVHFTTKFSSTRADYLRV